MKSEHDLGCRYRQWPTPEGGEITVYECVCDCCNLCNRDTDEETSTISTTTKGIYLN